MSMTEHRPIDDEDDYQSFIEDVAAIEVASAAEFLGVDPESPDDPDELLEAVDETLWENIDALELFTYDHPEEWGSVIAFQRGGVQRFSDWETYATGDSPRAILKSLALACVHFDVYSEVLDRLGD